MLFRTIGKKVAQQGCQVSYAPRHVRQRWQSLGPYGPICQVDPATEKQVSPRVYYRKSSASELGNAIRAPIADMVRDFIGKSELVLRAQFNVCNFVLELDNRHLSVHKPLVVGFKHCGVGREIKHAGVKLSGNFLTSPPTSPTPDHGNVRW